MTDALEIKPLTGALGAEVHGVQLSELSADEFDAIETAWLEHLVLFFRDQQLTPEQHIAFAEHFGPAQKPGFVPTLDEYPQIRRQEYDESTQIGNDVTWHTDDTFLDVPSKGSVLYALDVPATGGDTVWVNARRAYEALSPPLRDFLDGLTAVHDLVATMGPGVLKQHGVERFKRFMDSTPAVEHPVVRVHPVTGRKAIFVNPQFTLCIKGMEERESRALLDTLFRVTSVLEYHYRHRWEPDTVVFWDNRSAQHSAVHDYYPQRRLMERVTIKGDRPFGPGAPADPAELRRFKMPPITAFEGRRAVRQHERD